MRTFRCIYTSCFNKLRFLAENSTKLQKLNFFGQFKDHNLARKHGSQTNDIFFSSIFHALTVTFIFFLKIVKTYFPVLLPPIWSIVVCKILDKSYRFGQPITLFQQADTLRLIKVHIIFYLPRGSHKKLSAHGLILVVLERKSMEIQKFRSSAKPQKFLPLKQSQKKSECIKFTYFTDESFI